MTALSVTLCPYSIAISRSGSGHVMSDHVFIKKNIPRQVGRDDALDVASDGLYYLHRARSAQETALLCTILLLTVPTESGPIVFQCNAMHIHV